MVSSLSVGLSSSAFSLSLSSSIYTTWISGIQHLLLGTGERREREKTPRGATATLDFGQLLQYCAPRVWVSIRFREKPLISHEIATVGVARAKHQLQPPLEGQQNYCKGRRPFARSRGRHSVVTRPFPRGSLVPCERLSPHRAIGWYVYEYPMLCLTQLTRGRLLLAPMFGLQRRHHSIL